MDLRRDLRASNRWKRERERRPPARLGWRPATVLMAMPMSSQKFWGRRAWGLCRVGRGVENLENQPILNSSLLAAGTRWDGPGRPLSTSSRNAALGGPPPRPPSAPSLRLPKGAPLQSLSHFQNLPCPLFLHLAPTSRPLAWAASPFRPPPTHRLTSRGASALGCARVGAPRQLRVAALTPPSPPPSAAQPAPAPALQSTRRLSGRSHREPVYHTRSQPRTPGTRVMNQSAPGRRAKSQRRERPSLP
nr:wiskott-Aldrich syndrome protein family member 1-like [Peromyscus maniculatus bairdii]